MKEIYKINRLEVDGLVVTLPEQTVKPKIKQGLIWEARRAIVRRLSR